MIATHARRLFLVLGLAASTALGTIATPASAQIPYFHNLLAAAQATTQLGVRDGETVSVVEAMDGMATKSANDMAVAMAEKLGGSESRFAALMTLRAQELGMQNTHFVNASGLPDSRQISSARDIAILSRAVMRDYPQYYRL